MTKPSRWSPFGFRTATVLLAAGAVVPLLGAMRVAPPVNRFSTPAEAIRLAGPAGYTISLPRFDGVVSSSLPGSTLVTSSRGVPASAMRGTSSVPASSASGTAALSPAEARAYRVSRAAFTSVASRGSIDSLAEPGAEQGEALIPAAQSRRETVIMGGGPEEGGARETMLGEALAAERPGGTKESRPDSPGSVAVTSVQGMVITIQWTDRSTNETGFVIEHQIRVGSTWTGGGTYTVTAGRETSDITVSPGSHRFRVAATGAGGTSRWTSWSASVDVNGVSEPVPLVPSQPENLVVAAGSGSTAVSIRWDDTSANETGFEIERSPGFSSGTRTVGANVAQTFDEVSPGTYQYRVRSFNANGTSMYTAWAQFVVTSAPPAAPTSPAARDQGNERDITVQWVDASDNEERFVIERQKQIAGLWGDDTVLTAPVNATSLVDPAGLGTFRYRIAAANTVGQSSFTAWASATATASGGWTEFTPSADTRIVYVSSSEGVDTNDGLSPGRAKRTIAAGKALLRNGYPDWMLLKRGDVWTNETFGNCSPSGRSEHERMLYGSYGESPTRPLIQTGVQPGISRLGAGRTDYVAFVGLHFTPHLRSASDSPKGFTWLDSGRHILIEDCKFDGYKDNISIQGNSGVVEDVIIRRCIVVNAYHSSSHAQGLYASIVRNLTIDACFFDHNGWREGLTTATVYNHNIYIQANCTNVAIRDTASVRGSSHGAQLRPGGTVSNCLFSQNAIALLIGTGGVDGGGVDPLEPVITDAMHNVIVEGRDISPTSPRGFGIDVLFASGGTISHNLIKDQGSATSPVAITLDGGQGGGNHNVQIVNNVVYNWNGPVVFTGDAQHISSILFEGNVVHSEGPRVPLVRTADPATVSAVAFRNNRFWAPAATPGLLMRIGSTNHTFSSWRSAVSDEGSALQATNPPDPGVSLDGYAASMGINGGSAELFERMAARPPRQWNPALSVESINAYFRAGFGIPDPH
jgi:hypothetical protein